MFTCYNSLWKLWQDQYCHNSIEQGRQHLLLQCRLTTVKSIYQTQDCTHSSKPQSHSHLYN